MKFFRVFGGEPDCGSPPTRGAWIEIIMFEAEPQTVIVAPYEGGVD